MKHSTLLIAAFLIFLLVAVTVYAAISRAPLADEFVDYDTLIEDDSSTIDGVDYDRVF